MNLEIFNNIANVFKNRGMRLDTQQFMAFIKYNLTHHSDITYEEYIRKQYCEKENPPDAWDGRKIGI